MLAFDEFIDNNYFNAYFVEHELPKFFEGGQPDVAFQQIKAVYAKLHLSALSEAQLEEEFIKPVLKALGYAFAYQVNKKAFGKSHRPDFALFQNEELKNIHYQDDKASNENILALCESKAYHVPLDNKKTTEENPHFQLVRYLSDLKISFGFLTNGRFWRFYDISLQNKEKVFYQIDLEWIIANDNTEAFSYFYYIFYKNYLTQLFTPPPSGQRLNLAEMNQVYILRVENDLKELIYGDNSIIEIVGQQMFTEYGKDYKIREIYSNSVFFAFRMLFIAYFESKFNETLFESHRFYKTKSLRAILHSLENDPEYWSEDYQGWSDLQMLFQYLDKGNLNLRLPLLNGGLFAEEKAPLLTKPFILNNADLKKILSLLLYHAHTRAWRDFKTLSVTHIGNIYEGLLESEFRQAFDGVYYLVYTLGKTEKEGYYDRYDYEALKKDKKVKLLKERFYAETQLYLSNQASTRKTTASYYTPADITQFMAQDAIESALAQKESILDVRIIDNACGSGHFLIECLKQLTVKAIERLMDGNDPKLKQALATEKEIAEANLSLIFGKKTENFLDELTLLKRILLKKIIFGVDLNGFAIELTRLSLWLDTFVFGTPLSFIEHHIKQGNALIGATKKELFDNLAEPGDLFATKLRDRVKALIDQLSVLSDLKDTTEAEVTQSKRIYASLQPTLQQLNLAMNFHTFRRFVPFLYDKEKAKEKQIALGSALHYFQKDIFERGNTELVREIEETSQKFSFFNYELEFAEVFQNGHAGFDLVIGNPPWDVVEFSEQDFFPRWRSSYRSMKQSEKEETRLNVLDYAGVREEYEYKKAFIINSNEYYKSTLPLSEGGKGNLFRFFIERNLNLLNKSGALAYITPSAWIYEDSSTKLRKHILNNYRLHHFYQFENRKGVFPDVDSRYKFALFKITHTPAGEKPVSLPVRFMKTDTAVLYKGQAEVLQYPYADIVALSPESWALFEVREERDLTIIRKAYQKFSPINPDFIDFRNELNLTSDKGLFKEKPDSMILYEGKMVHQFNNHFAEPQYWVNQQEFEEKLLPMEVNRLISDIYAQIPTEYRKGTHKDTVLKYLECKEDDLRKLTVFDKAFPRLVIRDIGSNTNERSIISAIIPAGTTYGHTLQGFIPKKYTLYNKEVKVTAFPLARQLFIQSVFNSLVLDFLIRFLIDIHVSKSYLMRMPIPQPADAELLENDLYRKLIVNTLKINRVINPQLELKVDGLEILAKDLPKTEKQRIFLQIENDCLVAQFYGLTPEELRHLTGPTYFKVLNENSPQYVEELCRQYEVFVGGQDT